jgi:hypothetical protein
MTRPELLKRLDTLLEKAEKETTYGCIEIELRSGRATVIRKTETDRLDGENPRVQKDRRY